MVLALLLGCCGRIVYGQEADYQWNDTIQIEASRLGQRVDQMGRSVTVIDRAQIRQLPVRSLDELLRFLPGVEVQARGAFGTQADLSMRGGTFNQTLVLMDGMRINDPLTGHFHTYLPVTLEEIERIEVIRGPSSAQYGPDAVGGVINIVTRTFAAQAEAGPAARVQAQAGQHGLLLGEAGASLPLGPVRFGASARYAASDGHPLPGGERADFDIRTGSAALAWDFAGKWNLALRSGWDQRLFQAQRFYTLSPLDQAREQTSRWWNQARLLRRESNRETRLDLSFLSSQDSFLFNPAVAANVHQTGMFNANLHHLEVLSPRFSLAGGLQASRRSIESSDRGNHQDDHAAAYVLAQANLAEGLHLTGSLRADQDRNYGLEFCPQLNVSYQAGAVLLRGGAGRSIRAADYTERFVSTNLAGPVTSGRNLGNPDLLAERSWSYEAGGDWRITPALQASATLFHRQGRNLIDYVLTSYEDIPRQGNLSPGATYLFASNLAALNLTGLEARLSGRHTAGQLTAAWDLGYTWLMPDTAGGVVSKYLSNTARHQLTARGMLSHRIGSLGIQGLYRERDEASAAAIGADLTPRFMVWHVQAQVWVWKKSVSLQGQVFNVLNEQYADLLGAQMPGRWWTLGLAWQWAGRNR